MMLERLDGSPPVKPQRWWRRLLPIRTIQDRILLWAWGSLVLTLLSFACSLLGDNFTAIAFAAFLAASLTLVGAIMDITALKKTNAELERSEQRYRQLFSRMPIAFRQLDASRLVALFRKLRAEGVKDLGAYFDSHPEFLRTCMDALTFQEANERAIQMFGGGVEGFVGRSMADTWRERPDTFRRAMESRYRGETNFEEETKMVTWDGRIVDVLFTTARVGPINDLEISLVGTIDISQRLRAQQKLQQVQAEFAHAARVSMLGELTASIAHEVNQPLAAIATNGAAGCDG
jgi:PAS domain S-box-containing protein